MSKVKCDSCGRLFPKEHAFDSFLMDWKCPPCQIAQPSPSARAYDACLDFSVNRYYDSLQMTFAEECSAWSEEGMKTCQCEACHLWRQDVIKNDIEAKVQEAEMDRIRELAKLPFYTE